MVFFFCQPTPVRERELVLQRISVSRNKLRSRLSEMFMTQMEIVLLGPSERNGKNKKVGQNCYWKLNFPAGIRMLHPEKTNEPTNTRIPGG